MSLSPFLNYFGALEPLLPHIDIYNHYHQPTDVHDTGLSKVRHNDRPCAA